MSDSDAGEAVFNNRPSRQSSMSRLLKGSASGRGAGSLKKSMKSVLGSIKFAKEEAKRSALDREEQSGIRETRKRLDILRAASEVDSDEGENVKGDVILHIHSGINLPFEKNTKQGRTYVKVRLAGEYYTSPTAKVVLSSRTVFKDMLSRTGPSYSHVWNCKTPSLSVEDASMSMLEVEVYHEVLDSYGQVAEEYQAGHAEIRLGRVAGKDPRGHAIRVYDDYHERHNYVLTEDKAREEPPEVEFGVISESKSKRALDMTIEYRPFMQQPAAESDYLQVGDSDNDDDYDDLDVSSDDEDLAARRAAARFATLQKAKSDFRRQNRLHKSRSNLRKMTKSKSKKKLTRSKSKKQLQKEARRDYERLRDGNASDSAPDSSDVEFDDEQTRAEAHINIYEDMEYIPDLGPPLKGVLKITLLRGNGLRAADMNQTSDPYCELSLTNDYHRGQKLRSRVIDRNLNPVWDQRMRPLQLADLRSQSLKINVYDKDVLSDDFLGNCEIDLGEPDFDLESEEAVQITRDLGGGAGATGTITVLLQFEKAPDQELPKRKKESFEASRGRALSSRSLLRGPGAVRPRHKKNKSSRDLMVKPHHSSRNLDEDGTIANALMSPRRRLSNRDRLEAEMEADRAAASRRVDPDAVPEIEPTSEGVLRVSLLDASGMRTAETYAVVRVETTEKTSTVRRGTRSPDWHELIGDFQVEDFSSAKLKMEFRDGTSHEPCGTISLKLGNPRLGLLKAKGHSKRVTKGIKQLPGSAVTFTISYYYHKSRKGSLQRSTSRPDAATIFDKSKTTKDLLSLVQNAHSRDAEREKQRAEAKKMADLMDQRQRSRSELLSDSKDILRSIQNGLQEQRSDSESQNSLPADPNSKSKRKRTRSGLPTIQGMLNVRLLSVEGLADRDSESNTSVVVRVGDQTQRSIEKRGQNPLWSNYNMGEFVVHDFHNDRMSIQVYDDDTRELLGSVDIRVGKGALKLLEQRDEAKRLKLKPTGVIRLHLSFDITEKVFEDEEEEQQPQQPESKAVAKEPAKPEGPIAGQMFFRIWSANSLVATPGSRVYCTVAANNGMSGKTGMVPVELKAAYWSDQAPPMHVDDFDSTVLRIEVHEYDTKTAETRTIGFCDMNMDSVNTRPLGHNKGKAAVSIKFNEHLQFPDATPMERRGSFSSAGLLSLSLMFKRPHQTAPPFREPHALKRTFEKPPTEAVVTDGDLGPGLASSDSSQSVAPVRGSLWVHMVKLDKILFADSKESFHNVFVKFKLNDDMPLMSPDVSMYAPSSEDSELDASELEFEARWPGVSEIGWIGPFVVSDFVNDHLDIELWDKDSGQRIGRYQLALRSNKLKFNKDNAARTRRRWKEGTGTFQVDVRFLASGAEIESVRGQQQAKMKRRISEDTTITPPVSSNLLPDRKMEPLASPKGQAGVSAAAAASKKKKRPDSTRDGSLNAFADRIFAMPASKPSGVDARMPFDNIAEEEPASASRVQPGLPSVSEDVSESRNGNYYDNDGDDAKHAARPSSSRRILVAESAESSRPPKSSEDLELAREQKEKAEKRFTRIDSMIDEDSRVVIPKSLRGLEAQKSLRLLSGANTPREETPQSPRGDLTPRRRSNPDLSGSLAEFARMNSGHSTPGSSRANSVRSLRLEDCVTGYLEPTLDLLYFEEEVAPKLYVEIKAIYRDGTNHRKEKSKSKPVGATNEDGLQVYQYEEPMDDIVIDNFQTQLMRVSVFKPKLVKKELICFRDIALAPLGNEQPMVISTDLIKADAVKQDQDSDAPMEMFGHIKFIAQLTIDELAESERIN
jgi:C2 domain